MSLFQLSSEVVLKFVLFFVVLFVSRRLDSFYQRDFFLFVFVEYVFEVILLFFFSFPCCPVLYCGFKLLRYLNSYIFNRCIHSNPILCGAVCAFVISVISSGNSNVSLFVLSVAFVCLAKLICW